MCRSSRKPASENPAGRLQPDSLQTPQRLGFSRRTAETLPCAPSRITSYNVCYTKLLRDISPLVALDAEQICERLYTPRAELGELAPIGIKLVHINKCPVLAPAASLSESRADELGLDRARCRQSLDTLRRHPEIREKLLAVYGMERDRITSYNVCYT